MSNEVVHTKFGNAKIAPNGYYLITSRKEGNYKKRLHILIYEDHHRCCILPKNIVHHIDGNRLNNDISNLQLMSWGEHTRLHHKNKKMPETTKEALRKANTGRSWWKGKHHSEESKKKLSEVQKGRIITDEHKLKLSKSKNKTGYFRVSIEYSNKFKQGFRYRYIYLENGKRKEIKSIDLEKLKEKVLKKGLPWIKLDEDNPRSDNK